MVGCRVSCERQTDDAMLAVAFLGIILAAGLGWETAACPLSHGGRGHVGASQGLGLRAWGLKGVG